MRCYHEAGKCFGIAEKGLGDILKSNGFYCKKCKKVVPPGEWVEMVPLASAIRFHGPITVTEQNKDIIQWFMEYTPTRPKR